MLPLTPSTTQEGKFYYDLCGHFPTMSKKGNRYIYIMYVYYCNAIIKTPINNRSEKDMIHAFTELTTYLKIHGINLGFHIVYNKSATALKSL